MVKISVIIPVYNTGDYLKNCLDSIINQTFEDIEIICINDGSTDNSLDILNEYQQSDSRIQIYSQENEGLSSARNTGLNHVTGDYTYFIDSDDTLNLDALNNLYRIAEEKSLDLILFKLINVDVETGERYSDNYYDMKFLKDLVGDELFNYETVGENLYDLAVSIPGKFFKTDLISDMRFKKGFIFEDNPFFIEAFLKANRVYFYDEYLYNRSRRKNSIMSNDNPSFADAIPISNMIIDITKEYGHYNEFKDKIFNKKIFQIYFRYSSVNSKIKSGFFEEIKKDFSFFKDEVENDINLISKNRRIFENVLKSDDFSEFDCLMRMYENLREVKRNEISRLDIKNVGVKTNSIEILDNSDDYSNIEYPKWFSDETGEGLLVESDNGELNLKLKMINDGKLKINLKSISLLGEDGKRRKCCVDYTSLVVDNKEYLRNHNPYWHNNSFVLSKDIQDGQIVDIHVEWMTYEKQQMYIDEINNKNKKAIDRRNDEVSKLIKQINKLENENKKLKKELNEVYSSNSWKVTKPLRKIRGN